MLQQDVTVKQDIGKDFQRNILTAIRNQDDVVFVTYSLISDTEDKLIYTLAKILERHERVDILTPILSCIKELVANALKANAKQVLIEEGKIDNPDDPREVIMKIRSILNQEGQYEYGIKAKNRRLSTRIYLKVKYNNLIVEVVNNLPLPNKEQHRIHDRIEQASQYDNIAEFFMAHPDPEAEGMGLGLSMIVVLLKNINISHKNIVVTTDGRSKTQVRLIIPMK